MQTLEARGTERGRIVLFVPRWIPAGVSLSGMPYKVFPILSSLARHGFRVELFTEVHDGIDGPRLRQSLSTATAAVAWCAEMNPGTQIAGLLAFLRLARESAPSAIRACGGAFFYLIPDQVRRLDDPEAEVFLDSGIPTLAKFLCSRISQSGGSAVAAPEAPAERIAKLDPLALLEIDLKPFFRPEGMLFDNDEPTLQIPTALGCAKACEFCFYERTRLSLLDAESIADIVESVRDRFGVRQFLMGELDFFASRTRVLALGETFARREIRVRWFALASVSDIDVLSDDDIAAIARSGCHSLELGTEVGSDQALAKIGKRYSSAAALRVTRRLLEHGILPIHNILFGFVGETGPDRRATIDMIRALRALGSRVRFNFRFYQAAPNTTMGDVAFRSLPPLPSTLPGFLEMRQDMAGGRALPWLSDDDEREVRRLVDYYLPLAYDDALADGQVSRLRQWLARFAQWRCRVKWFGAPVDRYVFERFERVGLAGTFLP